MSPGKSFTKLPGFRDFVPADLALRNHIFEAWRSVCRRYGFAEYDGPPLEPLGLYVEKSGPEIVEQLYNFEDKGGREVALRPEMTPTLARILAERSRGMAKPVRWFSIPQLFRYERSQRGRLREHFQLNADIVGEAGVGADAEVAAVAIDAVRAVGLGEGDFVARVNDRRLVAAVLDEIGVAEGRRAGCLAVIDKAGRAGPEKTRTGLEGLGIGDAAAEVLAELVADGSREHLRDRFRTSSAVLRAMEPLEEHREILEAMGLGGHLRFDFTVVRGLAYYTGIVFELFDRAGEMRAICGGGRYDRLLELVGGEPLPAVGFGMGDVVLGELLKDRGIAAAAAPGCDDYVIWMEPAQRSVGMRVACALRRTGRSVLYGLAPGALGKQLRNAARQGAARALIVGPDEAASETVTVRELGSGMQERVPLAKVLDEDGEGAGDAPEGGTPGGSIGGEGGAR